MCEEYEPFHERTGRPVVIGESSSSLVSCAIKTEVLLDNDHPAYQCFYCDSMENEKLSQQDKLS